MTKLDYYYGDTIANLREATELYLEEFPLQPAGRGK